MAVNPIRPALRDHIDMQLQICSVHDVDSAKQTLTVELFVRTVWHDPRHRYNESDEGGCFATYLSPQGEVGFAEAQLKHIWTPGLTITNVAVPEQILYSAFWLFPDGLTWWTRKSMVILTCAMNFKMFPYDVQLCPMNIAGWRDLSSDISLGFRDNTPSKFTEGDIAGTVEWDLITVSSTDFNPEQSGFAWGGVGICWLFELKRRAKYYELYVIMPASLFVLISWASFFISRVAVPAQVAVTIIWFLSISGQIASILSRLPSVSGEVKMLSFLSCSQAFVLALIVEYTACNFLDQIQALTAKALEKIKKESEEEGRTNVNYRFEICKGKRQTPFYFVPASS
eukprot:CAMPEP_0172936400 /NCGR_PEP_ID=MMETSP1075-20121228/222002_1 /TAXON_ID=2916 /ORGANISM="Ceratium fusus, Strain PA161109" /LENGTH=340 /DNA_ID=CAMNT_0013797771 /DNA_START=114 /DNA_END=1136 /DNA_ORIENTATION=+